MKSLIGTFISKIFVTSHPIMTHNPSKLIKFLQQSYSPYSFTNAQSQTPKYSIQGSLIQNLLN